MKAMVMEGTWKKVGVFSGVSPFFPNLVLSRLTTDVYVVGQSYGNVNAEIDVMR